MLRLPGVDAGPTGRRNLADEHGWLPDALWFELVIIDGDKPDWDRWFPLVGPTGLSGGDQPAHLAPLSP